MVARVGPGRAGGLAEEAVLARVWKGEQSTGTRAKGEDMSPFTRASGSLTGTCSVGGDFLGKS